MKNRNYIFTYFPGIEKNFFDNIIDGIGILPQTIAFLTFQYEKCPETRKTHIQGYLELTKPCRINVIKKLLQCEKIHLEYRKGSQEQAIDYSNKTETRIKGPFTFGTCVKQGKRNDLSCLKNLKTQRLSDFIIENPEIAIKYPQGIKLIKNAHDIKMGQSQMRDIKCTAIIGKPGSGKTRYIYDNYDIENIYKLNTNSNGTLWFDGYENQTILLIDDFKGWIKYTELLTILDRYPYRCQIKGGFTYANWDKVFITSNYAIDDWYDASFNIEAIKRRIHNLIKRDEVVG